MSKAHDQERPERPGPPKRRVLRRIDPKRAAMAPPEQAPPAPRPSAHNSAPPVVSTVATHLATYQDSLPDAPSGSSWRGVVMGTVLGLAIVGAFVAGARLAHRSTVPAGEAAPPAAAIAPPAATTVPPAQAAPSPPPAAPPAVQEPGPPAIAATLLPTVKPPRSVKAAKPLAAKLATTPPAASAPVQAVAVESPDPAPADSAPSLVPVIPPAPKPTVDPFVRAVQQDIQEDQSSGH